MLDAMLADADATRVRAVGVPSSLLQHKEVEEENTKTTQYHFVSFLLPRLASSPIIITIATFVAAQSPP